MGTVYYRVVVKDNDNSQNYSDAVAVTIISSGISGTWGSIKAMFR